MKGLAGRATAGVGASLQAPSMPGSEVRFTQSAMSTFAESHLSEPPFDHELVDFQASARASMTGYSYSPREQEHASPRSRGRKPKNGRRRKKKKASKTRGKVKSFDRQVLRGS